MLIPFNFLRVYQQITGINARGQVESEVYGNGVVQTNVYDAPMGYLDNASVTRSGVTHQSYHYSLEAVGNVTHLTAVAGHKPGNPCQAAAKWRLSAENAAYAVSPPRSASQPKTGRT